MTSPAPYNPFEFKRSPVRQPMFWAALAYGAGIVVDRYAWRPAAWLTMAVVMFIAFSVYLRRRRFRSGFLLAYAALCIIGALYYQARQRPNIDTSIFAFADDQPVQLEGYALADGRIQPAAYGQQRETFDFRVEQIGHAASAPAHPRETTIALSIYGRGPIPQFRCGDRLQLTAQLHQARNFHNPGSFDYAGYLREKGILTLASARVDSVQQLPGTSGGRMGRWLSQARAAVIHKLLQLFPEDQARLLDAMLIGEEAFVDRDTRVDFQRTGAYHALIVSGLSVSILAGAIFWTLRRLRCGVMPSTLVTILLCCAFALLTQEGAPVWRATSMNAIYLIARLLYRRSAVTNALGTAALAVLAFDPRQLFTASFQMTFLCLLIIGAIATPLLDRPSRRVRSAIANWHAPGYAHDLHPLSAQLRLDLKDIARALTPFLGSCIANVTVVQAVRAAILLFELLAVAFLMQTGLALPIAYYFHRAIALSVPANLVVIPLLGGLIPLTALSVLLSFISLKVAAIPAFIAGIALRGIVGSVHHIGAARLADLRVPDPTLLVIAAACAALAVAMFLSHRRPRIAALAVLALFASNLAIMFPAPPARHAGTLEMTSIDVGQGDSILLIMPQGQTLLIDAGGPIGGQVSRLDFGEDVVSPYLWSRGISRLDAVAVTHGHSDHIGGMKAVLANFHPRELWIGLLPPSTQLDDLIVEAHALNIHVVRHWAGDSFSLGGAAINVLYPALDTPIGREPRNSDSMVLRVTYGQTSALLEGDADASVESEVLRRFNTQADVLKVGHHGSATSTSAQLLSAVKPRYAVISDGFHNPFGHPRFDVLQRLSQSRTRVYRTDCVGAVTFLLDGRNVSAQPAEPH